jgi:molybdopterin-guanine dinucleotide biosynthesis protein A
VSDPAYVPTFAAILLAGGTGARMSGADKSAIELDGRTLLEHALDAVIDAVEVVVVGDPVPTDSLATFVREDPAYGGPAAAVLTGLGQLLGDAPLVVVLAVDMPRVTPHTLRRLRVEMAGHDGATLVDATGRRQLAMALDLGVLRAAAPAYESWHGLPLKALLTPLDLVEVPAIGDEARDVDTWADLRDLRG